MDNIFGIPDSRIENWPYFNSPIPLLTILTVYLYFTLIWCEKFMASRRPMALRKIFIVYDGFQIIACFWITICVISLIMIFKIDWRCGEMNNDVNYTTEWNIFIVYHFLKVLDLAETVFYLLNKRDENITFPHLYHHVVMVVSSWLLVRYAPGGHSVFLPFINSSINIIKYYSYLTTAYDKSKRRCLFWRRHHQNLQVVQFLVTLIIYVQPLVEEGCSFPKGILVMGLSQVVLLLIFSIYYNIVNK